MIKCSTLEEFKSLMVIKNCCDNTSKGVGKMHYEIKRGDCLELMKGIPDGSIDLVVTDPPYLMSYKTNHRKDKRHKFCSEINGDKLNDQSLINDYINECYRVLKEDSAMYMFCNQNRVEIFKQYLEKNGFNIKNMIIWVKNNWTAGDLKCQFGKQYEVIFLVNKGRKEFNGKRITDVWFFDRVAGKNLLHQNQKPVDLLELMINKHSCENDVVFDGFMGSGSTGVACQNTNRNFIGYELDKDYFEISKKRLEDNAKHVQISLF